jgi:hypothetical protein
MLMLALVVVSRKLLDQTPLGLAGVSPAQPQWRPQP